MFVRNYCHGITDVNVVEDKKTSLTFVGLPNKLGHNWVKMISIDSEVKKCSECFSMKRITVAKNRERGSQHQIP